MTLSRDHDAESEKNGWFNIFLLKLLLNLHSEAVCSAHVRETSFRQRLEGITPRHSPKQRCFVVPWAIWCSYWGPDWFGSESSAGAFRSSWGSSI